MFRQTPFYYFSSHSTSPNQHETHRCVFVYPRDLSKFSEASFRLDHDEGVFGLSTHLTNLSRLMENSPDR